LVKVRLSIATKVVSIRAERTTYLVSLCFGNFGWRSRARWL